MMSLIGDKSSVWILWLPCGGRKSGVGVEPGAGTRQRQPKRGHEVSSVAGSQWRGVSSAWPSPCEEGNRRGFGRPLGRTGLQTRTGWEAGGAARPRLGHTGVGETEAAGRAGLGFQLSFGPQPE
jgi:hypothetical protein